MLMSVGLNDVVTQFVRGHAADRACDETVSKVTREPRDRSVASWSCKAESRPSWSMLTQTAGSNSTRSDPASESALIGSNILSGSANSLSWTAPSISRHQNLRRCVRHGPSLASP